MWENIKKAGDQIYRILRRKLSYQDCFMDQAGNFTLPGKLVIKDLAKFCNMNTSSMRTNPVTGNSDPYLTAFNEGKRAVFNRIIKHCYMDDAAISKLYKELEANE
jgi:hypothetical protein